MARNESKVHPCMHLAIYYSCTACPHSWNKFFLKKKLKATDMYIKSKVLQDFLDSFLQFFQVLHPSEKPFLCKLQAKIQFTEKGSQKKKEKKRGDKWHQMYLVANQRVIQGHTGCFPSESALPSCSRMPLCIAAHSWVCHSHTCIFRRQGEALCRVIPPLLVPNSDASDRLILGCTMI